MITPRADRLDGARQGDGDGHGCRRHADRRRRRSPSTWATRPARAPAPSAGTVALVGAVSPIRPNTAVGAGGRPVVQGALQRLDDVQRVDRRLRAADRDKLDSSTATDIHNADHQVITHAPIGSTVHDKATVTGTAAGGRRPARSTSPSTWATRPARVTAPPAGPIALDRAASPIRPTPRWCRWAACRTRRHYNGSTTLQRVDRRLRAARRRQARLVDGHRHPQRGATRSITSAPIGSTVHDKATVSGSLTTPTGNVDFTWLHRQHARARRRRSRRRGRAAAARSSRIRSTRATVPVGGALVQGDLQRRRHVQRGRPAPASR